MRLEIATWGGIYFDEDIFLSVPTKSKAVGDSKAGGGDAKLAQLLLIIPLGKSTLELLELLNAKGANRLLSLAIPESTKLLGGHEGSCVKRLDVSKPQVRPAASLSAILSRARPVVRHFSQILLDGAKTAQK